MSDKIRVTVVTSRNEKLNNSADDQYRDFNREPVIVTHETSATLMSTLLQNGLISGSFCGGRGDCGRCRIQFLKGAVMPTPLERSVLAPEELRNGYRLACLAKPKDDCVIRLALADEAKVKILSEMMDLSENNDQLSQSEKYAENRKAHDMSQNIIRNKATDSHGYIIAVDLGTTTIAMQLCDAADGEAADTYCEMNPQRSYGADVLSRIRASCEGQREDLKKMVWDVLERGMRRFKETLNRQAAGKTGRIRCMCIAGNTVMEHLLLGYHVESLGVSPFTPVEIGLQKVSRPQWDFPVYIAPGISAFVGGDIVTGLYALDMLDGRQGGFAGSVGSVGSTGSGIENPDKLQSKHQSVRLLIDLGTNGEMVISDTTRMIATATAAGPAFEGGAGAQVLGTDMIAITAAMLEKGVLDETGMLAEPYFDTGYTVLCQKSSFRIENKDIRNLQLAKAAVRAGVELLCDALGTQDVDRVYLAGGFGYFLDVEAAFRIGLLPEKLRGKVQAVGNTALAGAFRLAQDLSGNVIDQRALEERIAVIESMNLAKQEGFEKLYVRYMNLSPN